MNVAPGEGVRRAWLLLAACLAFGACKEEGVSVVTVPKSPEEAAEAADLLGWSLPRGWREEAGQGMRFATIFVGPVGRAYEVVVTRLEGDAGGFLANVNRWRGQLGLADLDEKGLGGSILRLPSAAGEVRLCDFLGKDPSGQPTRMLAGVVKTQRSSWFFKLVGPRPFIQKELPEFKSFLRSLRREK